MYMNTVYIYMCILCIYIYITHIMYMFVYIYVYIYKLLGYASPPLAVASSGQKITHQKSQKLISIGRCD